MVYRLSVSQTTLIKVFRVILGVVFLVAGTSKLFPLKTFISQIMGYNLPLESEFIQWTALILIPVEVWIGASLLLNCHLRRALLGAQILLIIMIPVTIWGSLQDAPSCGCYGELIERKPWAATVEDCILLLTTFLIAPAKNDSTTIQRSSNMKNMISIMIWIITAGSAAYAVKQYLTLIS